MTATAARRTRTPARPGPDQTRVWIYCRLSRETRKGTADEGLAIARQESACRALAAHRGWTVTEDRIYRENDTSANSKRKRPGWTELLTHIGAGQVDVVIAWAVDRLLRRPVEMETLIDLCERTGTRVITTQGDLDLETPPGKLAARMFVNMARFETDQKAARQRHAEVQAMGQGKPPARRAFGYRKGGMKIQPAEADAVRDGYRLLLAGCSLAEIARRWNAAGLITTRGHDWEPYAVRSVLLNPRNCGIRTYLGEETGPGIWDAIVEESTYRQAAALLRDPARQRSGGVTSRKHLLAGLARCSVCAERGVETTMRTAYRTSRQHTGGGEGRLYACRAGKHLMRLAEPIDKWVTFVVEERLTRPDLADVLAVEDPALAGLQAEEAELRARIRRFEADYKKGMVSGRLHKEAVVEAEAKLDTVHQRIAELTSTSRLAAVIGAEDPVAAFHDMDVPGKQGVIAALCTVTIGKGRPGRTGFDPATVTIDWR